MKQRGVFEFDATMEEPSIGWTSSYALLTSWACGMATIGGAGPTQSGDVMSVSPHCLAQLDVTIASRRTHTSA